MTNAMVTGATGFLGRHLCRRLTRLGWNVCGLGRNEAIGAELAAFGVRFIRADLRDGERVKRTCAGQDAVFHCGALSSPWGPYREFYAANVAGTRSVVDGCLAHGVGRLIHISTPSVYFDFTDREGIRESDPLPLKPANNYAKTKLMAERIAAQAFANGLPGLILRPRAIFGPLDRSLLPRILRLNSGRGVPLIDGGGALVDLTYVDNVVDAMLLGCEAPESALGQIYNVTNGEPAPLRSIIKTLFELLDTPLRERPIRYCTAYGLAALMEWTHRLVPMTGEPPLTRYTVGAAAKSQTLDISRARNLLGYTPRVSVREGLQAFADWWRAQEQ